MIFNRAYATLPEFINAVFNTDLVPNIPFNTYGFFVAMGFMVAAIIAAREIKRRTDLGWFKVQKKMVEVGAKPKWSDFVFPGIIGYFIGMKFIGPLIHDASLLTQGQDTVAFLFSSEGFHLYGIIAAIAYMAYTFYSINKKALPKPKMEEMDLEPQEYIGELVFVAALFGVIGASVFEVIQPNSEMTLKELFSDPMNFLSGLTIYGGLTFGIIGVLIYAFYRKLPPLLLFDSIAPGFLLAMAFGRMGCHFSGDGDWGIPVKGDVHPITQAPYDYTTSWLSKLPDYFWNNNYAHNVINEGQLIEGCVGNYCRELVPGVFPTAIYEIIMFFILFSVLWAVRKKISKIPGFVFLLMFVFSGIERYPIEMIRVTERYPSLFHLTQAQIISIFMVILGMVGIVYMRSRKDLHLK